MGQKRAGQFIFKRSERYPRKFCYLQRAKYEMTYFERISKDRPIFLLQDVVSTVEI